MHANDIDIWMLDAHATPVLSFSLEQRQPFCRSEQPAPTWFMKLRLLTLPTIDWYQIAHVSIDALSDCWVTLINFQIWSNITIPTSSHVTCKSTLTFVNTCIVVQRMSADCSAIDSTAYMYIYIYIWNIRISYIRDSRRQRTDMHMALESFLATLANFIGLSRPHCAYRLQQEGLL